MTLVMMKFDLFPDMSLLVSSLLSSWLWVVPWVQLYKCNKAEVVLVFAEDLFR
jgi:hypothetical protein